MATTRRGAARFRQARPAWYTWRFGVGFSHVRYIRLQPHFSCRIVHAGSLRYVDVLVAARHDIAAAPIKLPQGISMAA